MGREGNGAVIDLVPLYMRGDDLPLTLREFSNVLKFYSKRPVTLAAAPVFRVQGARLGCQQWHLMHKGMYAPDIH